MTAEIRFYHLERQSLEQVLPSLLLKALEQGRRVVIKAANDREAERLSEYLWSFHPDVFIPHGAKKDGYADRQPVWLTAENENPNGADTLILCQGAQTSSQDGFKLCCEMLDGRDEAAVSGARERWKSYKAQGLEVTYWRQGAKGWEKNA